jgi:hypothetical protein
MTVHDHLQVHVNDELVLDAGTCVQVSGPHGSELLIRPPEAESCLAQNEPIRKD